MNWWIKVLIVSLAGICVGCQKPEKEAPQVQAPAVEEKIAKTEANVPEQVAPVPVDSAAEAVPANPIMEELNKLLAEAAVYDYDKSRSSLGDLSEIIRSTSGEDRKVIEKRLAEFLKSDATLAGKDFVCRQLSVIGTEESVPALAALLTDEKTSDMARYALERIPAIAANDALVDALGKTSGRIKVGIINTLGERRYPKSVLALASLIYDSNSMVASAAVAAIGKIGGLQAANILSSVRKRAGGELRNLVTEAYLDCANQFAAGGERVQAIVIYHRLYDSNEATLVRIAALRGMVTSTGGQAAQILADAMKSSEPAILSAAITLVREVPAEEILKTAAAELPNLPSAVKAQMLTALSDCGYSAVLPEAVAAVKSEDAAVRLAALKAIGKLGNASNVQLLAETAAIAPGDEKQAARDGLYHLRGADVDATILSVMADAEPKVKVELIQAVGERNITSAADNLLGTAKDADRKVRIESVKALRAVGKSEQMPAIIELLKNAQGEAESAGLEKAVSAVAGRISDENLRVSAVLAAMGTVTDSKTKCSFINVLGRIGGGRSLAAVRAALKDSDAEVQMTAIRVLSDWSSPEPVGNLLQVAQSSSDKVQRVLALRGFIRLTGLDSERPAEDTIVLYKQAIKLAPSIEEKKMVLSGLSGMKTYAAIKAAADFLNDSELQEEAAVAVVKVAVRTKGEDNPEQTRAALQKVIEIAKTEQLRKQAQDALSKIK